MKIKKYDFPSLEEGRVAVETKYVELINKYRSGEKLDPEVIDWLDAANIHLMTSEDF